MRPSLKNNLFAVTRIKSFECGLVGKHFFFFFFYKLKLNERDFKSELKKGTTFIPVHFPFSSPSVYQNTFSAFLKGNREEIEKLNLRT